MLAKGKGFRRLTAVEVSDSGTDDEFQPLNSTKRYQDLSGEGVFVVMWTLYQTICHTGPVRYMHATMWCDMKRGSSPVFGAPS